MDEKEKRQPQGYRKDIQVQTMLFTLIFHTYRHTNELRPRKASLVITLISLFDKFLQEKHITHFNFIGDCGEKMFEYSYKRDKYSKEINA